MNYVSSVYVFAAKFYQCRHVSVQWQFGICDGAS